MNYEMIKELKIIIRKNEEFKKRINQMLDKWVDWTNIL